MIDYDDMNEVLSREERDLSEQEALRQRQIESERMEEEDRSAITYPYEACLECVRRVRHRLTRLQDWSRAEYEQISREEEAAGSNLPGLCSGLALHTLIYAGLLAVAAKIGGLTFAVFAALGVLWLVYTASFARKVLNAITTFRVMTAKPGTRQYAEDNRILTYAVRKERSLTRMQLIRENLGKLELREKDLHRQQGLSGVQYDRIQELVNVQEREEEFAAKKQVTFSEFRVWKKQQRRKNAGGSAAEENND